MGLADNRRFASKTCSELKQMFDYEVPGMESGKGVVFAPGRKTPRKQLLAWLSRHDRRAAGDWHAVCFVLTELPAPTRPDNLAGALPISVCEFWLAGPNRTTSHEG